MGRRMRTVAGLGGVIGMLLVVTACSDGDGEGDGGAGSEGGSEGGDGGGEVAGPVANADHWHAAFGFYICDQFLPDLPEFESPGGIHTHGDGVVHIHPFTDERAGENATLVNFLSDGGLTLTDDALAFGDEVLSEDGTDCDGEAAELTVVRWQDVQTSTDDPQVSDGDFGGLRFEQDGEGYTIAFVPEGTEVPVPETAANLAELGALDGPPPEAATSTAP